MTLFNLYAKFVLFWQNNTNLVKKQLILCEIGILLAKQFKIGKESIFCLWVD